MTCKYDHEADAYVDPDGEPCDVPRREHCTARKTCSQHLAWGEITCGRCLGRVRQGIKRIAELWALTPTAALESRRIDSELVMLAGPACDVEAWSWRKAAAKNLRDFGVGSWHQSLVEDDDDWHPYTVLTRWAQMLTEDYKIDRPAEWDISNAAAMLDRILHRVANDETQDFKLMRHEIGKCLNHLTGPQGLHVRPLPEKGAACPTCKAEEPPRIEPLVREYSHWCDDEDCTKIHTITEELDIWRCPRNPEHWWNPQGYANVLDERKGA